MVSLWCFGNVLLPLFPVSCIKASLMFSLLQVSCWASRGPKASPRSSVQRMAPSGSTWPSFTPRPPPCSAPVSNEAPPTHLHRPGSSSLCHQSLHLRLPSSVTFLSHQPPLRVLHSQSERLDGSLLHVYVSNYRTQQRRSEITRCTFFVLLCLYFCLQTFRWYK